MKISLTANISFHDSLIEQRREIGSIFYADIDRAKYLVSRNFARLNGIFHDLKDGNKIIVYVSFIGIIGGIETSIRHLLKAFPDRNFVFYVRNFDDYESIFRIGENHTIIVDNGIVRDSADVIIIMNFDGGTMMEDRFTAPKIYQFSHCDWTGLKAVGSRLKPAIVDGSKFIAVSETCKKGLEDTWGIKSMVVSNIFIHEDSKKTVFLVMSRATAEKGIEHLLDFIEACEKAGKDFVVYLCSQIYQANPDLQRRITKNKHIVIVEASNHNKSLYRAATYLVQLSSSESYCYSVREALDNKCPCIVSDIPELRKIIKDGENGYILNRDLSNLDIDKIFNEVPQVDGYSEEIDPKWNDLLDGKL